MKEINVISTFIAETQAVMYDFVQRKKEEKPPYVTRPMMRKVTAYQKTANKMQSSPIATKRNVGVIMTEIIEQFRLLYRAETDADLEAIRAVLPGLTRQLDAAIQRMIGSVARC
ncbi:hypothetical protein ACE1TF_12010 [Geomicrobium sp. JSM 1781026]|uniref:hypothetical protein n=1 Tax=Geomicrobium sp. JSM 1781026 TaxID=3344580 RepID=UPI0035C0DC85